MRILLVSQFYPGPEAPDYGVFVAQVVRGLEERGHTVDRAVIDRRGAGRKGDVALLREAVAKARRTKPDVIFAHFLLPAGFAAALASLWHGTPLVLMAHGQDVANANANALVRAGTLFALRRAQTTIFNSEYLATKLPAIDGRTEIIDCGVDLDRFRGGDQAAARRELGLEDAEGPLFLFVGNLIERKNVVRLRDAFERLGRGTLVVVGDGELRGELEGREGIRLVGRVPHADVPRWMAAADVVCLPSLEEPLGQVLLEAMAGERSVVATREGGPREFVTPAAGALVDPLDVGSIHAGLEHAIGLPSPNPAAREAAAEHDVRRQVARMEAVLEAACSTT